MGKINTIINWTRIKSLFLEHYAVGKSAEGADAYPPLLLLKCFLIQQWLNNPPLAGIGGECVIADVMFSVGRVSPAHAGPE
jgi:hypothetical protein